MIEELTLADAASGELMLETPPEEIDSEDTLHQMKAGAAVEPFLYLKPIRVGDRFEAISPNYRLCEVTQVQGNCCIVLSSILENQPFRHPTTGHLADSWKQVSWQEVWAVRSHDVKDQQDPRKTYRITHCYVTQENRALRRRENSLLVGKVVLVVREGQFPAKADPRGKEDAQDDSRQETHAQATSPVETGPPSSPRQPEGSGTGGGGDGGRQEEHGEAPAKARKPQARA